MKLEIKSCREHELSTKCSAVLNFISNCSDSFEVANYLNNNYHDDFYEVEDLSCWMGVLEKLDDILSNLLSDIIICGCLNPTLTENTRSKSIICNILRFLCLLLKSSKDKRYFLTLKTIHQLMRATDRDISMLAIEVIFNLCIPSSSFSTSLNDDWIDSFEIPDDIARDTLRIYQGLSLLSTEFGLVDYLHGHQPAFINMYSQKASISVKFPPRNDGEAAVYLDLHTSEWNMEDDSVIIGKKLSDFRVNNNLSGEEFWTVLNILNTIHGFQSTIQYRESIIKTRLRCFFLLVHSKISPELIQDYIRLGSPFIQDLVELADVSSEAMSELNLDRPVLLAYVALEAVLGLLENKLRRRSSFVVQSSILQILGLARNNSADAQVTSHRGAQGDVWSSIVLSACSAASAFYELQFNLAQPSEDNIKNSQLQLISLQNDQIISSTGKFIRIGLELFALSLTTREASNIINDMPTIGAIVGLIQGAIPHLSMILRKISSQGSLYNPCAYDVHVLLVVSKAFYCLELTIDRNEYLSAFRECDGITVVGQVIQLFFEADSDLNTPILLDSATRNLLESVLSVLVVSLQKSRHQQALLTVQSNAGETGQRIVSESYFSSLAYKIFRSPYHQNELVWSQVIAIFKEAIDTDASFLNTFIGLSCAEALVNAIYINPVGCTFSTLFTEKPSVDLEIILLPLSRLALMLCITAEGKAFIRKSRVLHFIIESLVQPVNLLPRSLGIFNDKLSKIGKVFIQIMIDFEEIKPEVKELLKKKIILYCKEAQSIWKAMTIHEQPNLDSTRVQTLQKLTNICSLVESMCNESRTNNSELVRDLMAEPVVEALIGAYSCTLPPSSQLFAQLSLRHTSNFPHYGHSSSAKSISSLLKLAASRVSQCATILVSLCKEIDEKLNIIGSTKQALRACQMNQSCEGLAAKESKDLSQSILKTSIYEDEDQFPISKSRRRSRGGSLGNSTNVLMLGILDCFPNKCVIDPNFYVELKKYGSENEIEKLSWQFLTSLLSLEWLSIMLSTAMRTDQRNPSSRAMTSNKDTFRRIFAFHRSSMLEVCRFAAQKASLKLFESNSNSRKGLLDSFCQCDSSEDKDFIPRVPSVYHLQVSGSGGALVREGIELEGRIVLIAEMGSRIDAYERRQNSTNVMRYRTAHGWISEYRRDHQKSLIVELIGMPVLSSSEIEEQFIASTKEAVSKKENNNLSELLTFREAASFCMTRAHGSLRQVVINLSRSMYTSDSTGLRAPVIPPSATTMSVSLSKIVKGFLTHPSNCLDESYPSVSKLMKDLKELQSTQLSLALHSKVTDNNATPMKSKRHSKSEKSLISPLYYSKNDFLRSPALGNQIGILDKPDESKEISQESTTIDLATLTLYYGTVVKHIIMPVMEDKNGSFNLLLLKTFCNQGVISFLMDTFLIILLVIKESISEVSTASNSTSVSLINNLNYTGKCALQALPSMIALFRRLVNRDLLNKSISSSISSPNSVLIDENGNYQAYELIFSLLHTIYRSTLPLIQKKILVTFPTVEQSECLCLISDMVGNLVTTMPIPRDIASSSKGNTSISDPRQGIRSIFASSDSQTPPNMEDRRSSRRMNIAYTGGLGNDLSLNSNNNEGGDSLISRYGATTRTTDSSRYSVTSLNSFVPDTSVITLLVEMGFERVSVTSAMNTLRSNNLNQVTEYLISHIHVPVNTVVLNNSEAILPLANENSADLSTVAVAVNQLSIEALPIPAFDLTQASLNERDQGDQLNSDIPLVSQFDSLPNLVNDLDSSDDNCDVNSTLETPSVLATMSESPAVAASESLSPEELRFNHQLSIERFREDISLLFDQSLPPPPLPENSLVLSTPPSQVEQATGHVAVSSTIGNSSTTVLPPEVFTKIIEDEDIVDEKNGKLANDTEFNKCSKALLSYAQEMCFAMVPHVLDVCINFEMICKWDVKIPHYFMSFLVLLLVKLNHSLGVTVTQGTGTIENSILYLKVYKELFTLLKHDLEISSTKSVFGIVTFLTQFLQDPTILKQLIDKKEFQRDECVILTKILIDLISKASLKPVLQWPEWISSTFILLNQILNIVPENNSLNLAIGKYLWSDISLATEVESEDINIAKNSSSDKLTLTTVSENPHSNVTTSMHLLDAMYLLPRKMRVDVLEVILNTIDSCCCHHNTETPSTTSFITTVYMNSDSTIGLLLVLSSLLIEQSFIETFVQRNGVLLLLKLSYQSKGSEDERKTEFKIISQILRKCMETEIEMQQQMFLQIQYLFNVESSNSTSSESKKKYISLKSFLIGLGLLMIRSTSDFIQICKSCVKFIKVLSKNSSSIKATNDLSIEEKEIAKYEIQVKLLDKEQLPDFSLNSTTNPVDNRCYKTLHSIVLYLVSEIKLLKMKDETITDSSMRYLQIGGILEALSDAVLILKRVPFLIGRLIKYENEGINIMAADESLIDFLINNYFGEKMNETSSKSATCLPSVSRFMVSLCAFQGTSRLIVLNSFVKALRSASMSTATTTTYNSSDAEIMDSKMIQFEEKRVLILSRLAALILIIIRVSKTSQKETVGKKDTTAKGQEGVCVETIYYLIENIGILKLLTNALGSLRVSLSLSSDAVCCIMEIIELITRPKLQTYLTAASIAQQQNAVNNTQAAVTAVSQRAGVHSDNYIDMARDDTFEFIHHLNNQNNSINNQHDILHSVHIPDDNRNDIDEEEEEDDEQEEEEEDDDDDEEEEEEESEYDEDEEHEEDEDENDFLNQAMSITLDTGNDSYINVDNILNSNDRNSRNNQTEAIMESFEQARMAMEHGLELRDLNLPSNSFVTPPDRLSQNITQFLIHGIENHDASSDFISNMVRRVRSGAIGGSLLSDQYTILLPGDRGGQDTIETGLAELLPQGISSALEVNQTSINHPLLNRQSGNLFVGPSVTAAVDNTPVGLQSYMPSRAPLFGFGNAAPSYGFRRPINAAPGNRTIIHFSSTGAWTDSRLPNSNELSGLGGLLDSPQFDDIDPVAAVWHQRNVNNPGQSQNVVATTLPIPEQVDINFFTHTFQQYIENNLISGLEYEDEITDDFSQVSFAEQSRGEDGGYSFSTQSNLALHDPNPRGTHGETDSRSENQDPIPPHIEIRHRDDHDANEDMSVITLPPEDCLVNQHLDDDMSVNTQLSAIVEEVPLTQQQVSQIQHESPINVVNPIENQRSLVNEVLNPILVNRSSVESNLDTNAINSISFDASLFQFPDTSLTAISTSDSALNNALNEIPDVQPSSSGSFIQEDLSQRVILTNGNSSEDSNSNQQIVCPPGYDSEIFYSLPLDMQLEIAEQHTETSDQMLELIETAGLDYNTIMALPEDIRREVLEQARIEQASSNRLAAGSGMNGNNSTGMSGAQDIDNASFLASLTLELRSEVLLTAEPDFLATLPPDLVAEAQMLRERAASTWQRRELMSRMGTREGNNMSTNAGQRFVTAEANTGIGAPDEFRDENDEDEDDDIDDEIDRENVEMHRRTRTSQVKEQKNEDIKPKLGLMRLPQSEKRIMKLPHSLFICISKVILHAPKQSAKCNALLFRILQNISNDLKMKDICLRLLLSLVSEKKDLLVSSIENLIPGQGSNCLDLLIEKKCDVYDKNIVVCNPKLNSKSKADQASTIIEITAIAAQRIVSILTLFVEGNSAFIYLLLAQRNANFLILDETLREIEQKAMEFVEISAKDQSEDVTNDNVLKGSSMSSSKCSDHLSTNSLLELLISLFAKPHVCNNISDLGALTNLLSLITSPLDSIDECVDNNDADSKVNNISIEQRNKDMKNKMFSIKVPLVVTSKYSLQFLCDVLLNDLCSKNILSNISNVISRLSKISANHALLIELISDSIIDLAEQSNCKLLNLAENLLASKANYEKIKESIQVDNNSKNVNGIVGIGFLPTNLIPVGEAGGRQHERLLRVVHTLHSMATKTNRSLFDVTPLEQLTQLWNNTDIVLNQLKLYLVEDEEVEKSDSNNTETKRPQSTLTSILNRLLPVIEVFFLVYTSDLLITKPETSGDQSATLGKVTHVKATDQQSVDHSFTTAAVTAMGDTLIPASSMPGHSYRTSKAYLSNNLSLFADSSGISIDESISLQSSHSFRKQLSYSQMNRTASSIRTSRTQKLLQFVQSHKGLLNLIIKAHPTLLDNSLAALVKITQLRTYLKFENKRKYFFTQLKKTEQTSSRRGLHLQIRRNQVFEDSFHQLRGRTAEEMKNRLQVSFYGEEGVDAGGLSREWFMILSREIFNPGYALFISTVDGATFQPSPNSTINTNHLDYFKFIGRIIGKAICDGHLMDAHFTRSFYKHVLGMPVDFNDIESTEPDYYKILKQIIETPLEFLMMDLTFSAEIQKFGRTEIVDLIPDGRNILVTDENKYDYIRLIAHHRMTAAIRAQTDAFLQGIYDLVPAELISIFSPTELELLICGLPEVNIEELQLNTDYHQYKATDDVIIWFWDTLKNFNREEKAAFLQFVTGTSKVPLGGFANLQGMRGNQRFSIHKSYGDTGLLPTAHTCFNQLDLPAYSNAEVLKEKLLLAISEGMEGFGFA